MKEMNRAMFDELVGGVQPVLVEFQAPWCGYCRRLKPAMDRIERELEGKLQMGSINIDLEEALSDREKIEVVPTLVIYREGKALGVERGVFRAPGGDKPFAMYRPLGEACPKPGYFGIALG